MDQAPYAFYVPENAGFTILDSALASARYALSVCEDPGDGTLQCRSVTTTADGSLVRYRGRLLDGVGYCADSVFAANHLLRFGRLVGSDEMCTAGLRLGRHALTAGFFADPDIPVRMYRDAETGEFLDNLEARPEYVELGHMARVGHELIELMEFFDADLRASAETAVRRLISWLRAAEKCPNGWFPRRATPTGRLYDRSPDALGPTPLSPPFPSDPLFDRSGAGCFVIQLFVTAQRAGLAEMRGDIVAAVETFIGAGGHFGSTNTDTEDLDENVSRAIAYLAIQAAADLLAREKWAAFALEECLLPLEHFELRQDLNGLETKGLLLMERSWNSACMWEIAMAAQSYLEAYRATRRRPFVIKALTMLRAIAKHHHGELGFLTEAVDWDGHSVAERHFGGAPRGDINDTHPFLNNLHVLEPTVTYLRDFAYRLPDGVKGREAFFDLEGNRLGPISQPINLQVGGPHL
jgi:hypothetical protein